MAPYWKFISKETGKEEFTQREEWCWTADYNDGTSLKQFDDDGIFHYFDEIDQSRLNIFSMIHDVLPPIRMSFREGLKLIYFHRNIETRGHPDGATRIRYPCFGFEGVGENKKAEIKLLVEIMPDGSPVITDGKVTIEFGVPDEKTGYLLPMPNAPVL